MPTNVKLTARFPVAWDLVGPWDGMLAALKAGGLDPTLIASLEAQVQTAKQQAVNLNLMLQALGDGQQGSLTDLSDLEARVAALEAAAAVTTTVSTVDDAVVVYELPIVGPDIGISGSSFLPITKPVTIPTQHAASESLSFYWSAGNSGVDAQWRLRNQTSGSILLSGSAAAPFSRVLLTDATSVSPMPSPGDEVALEVCFSGAGGDPGGDIELLGPVTWEVS